MKRVVTPLVPLIAFAVIEYDPLVVGDNPEMRYRYEPSGRSHSADGMAVVGWMATLGSVKDVFTSTRAVNPVGTAVNAMPPPPDFENRYTAAGLPIASHVAIGRVPVTVP